MDKLILNNMKTIMSKYNIKNKKEVNLKNLNLDNFYLSIIPDDCLEIACDYILQDFKSANESNYEFFEDNNIWWIFAETGSGDSWAMKIDHENEIAFIDHDQENEFKPHLLHINFEKWLQLADLNRQFEELNGYEISLSKEFMKKLELISKGLSEIYPYSID
ncbi:hypothetical protein [Clostridium tarantellae]|uniref:SMI1/KNR4 family protein n=1 Tax=Clostridium tarantellae TaxID=39493 RepID=A0A6I1MNI9_9CLOT|nr:hypothetical protein [Clostridium tarantellae]MPQ44530.1 hypothetical protein [Clostridium tarantellae]